MFCNTGRACAEYPPCLVNSSILRYARLYIAVTHIRTSFASFGWLLGCFWLRGPVLLALVQSMAPGELVGLVWQPFKEVQLQLERQLRNGVLELSHVSSGAFAEGHLGRVGGRTFVQRAIVKAVQLADMLQVLPANSSDGGSSFNIHHPRIFKLLQYSLKKMFCESQVFIGTKASFVADSIMEYFIYIKKPCLKAIQNLIALLQPKLSDSEHVSGGLWHSLCS